MFSVMKHLMALLILLVPSIAAADTLKTVNDDVNRSVRYATDMALFGQKDVWDIAGTHGDCESIALLKLTTLRQKGIADGVIGVYFDDEWNQWHAVLIVGDTILDSKRKFWHKRDTIRPVSSEKFMYKAQISNGNAWVVELAGKSINPQWFRRIMPAAGS